MLVVGEEICFNSDLVTFHKYLKMGDERDVDVSDSVEEILIDFGPICRFCLTETDGRISILDKCLIDTSVGTVNDTIRSFISRMTSIKMSDKQNFPLFVCNNCYNLVNICYNFNLICQQSDVSLQACYQKTLHETKAKLNCREWDKMQCDKVSTKIEHPADCEVSEKPGMQTCINLSNDVREQKIEDTKILKLSTGPKEHLRNIKENSIKQKYQRLNTLSARLKEAQSKLAEDILRSNDLMLDTVKNDCDINQLTSTVEKPQYACPQCSLKYKSAEALEFHYMATHGQTKRVSLIKYQCKSCPKNFSEQDRLIKHYKSIHKKSVICEDELNCKVQKLVKKKQKFFCLHCTPFKIFSMRDQLANHLDECHKDRLKNMSVNYSCNHCNAGPFPSILSACNHLKVVHILQKDEITWKDLKCISKPECESTEKNSSKIYVCTDCSPSVLFTSVDAYLQHNIQSHNCEPESIPLKDLPLDLVQSLISSLKQTKEDGSGFSFKISCKNCAPPMEFKTTSEFIDHMTSQHDKSGTENWDIEAKPPPGDAFNDTKRDPEQKWKCSECSAVYFRRHSLFYHMKEKHKKTVNFSAMKCPDCDETFLTNRKLIHHGIRAHQKYFANFHKVYTNNILQQACEEESRNKSFECDICQKKYVCKNSLKRHILKAHLGRSESETAVCPHCGKTLSSKLNLKSHVEFVHEALFVSCPVCKKKINFKTVGKHYKTHQTDAEFSFESGNQFLCNLCGKILKSKRSFEDHQKLHKNIRDQLCDICGSGFTTKKFLYLHKKTHEGAKRKVFSCSQCDKVFSGRHTLNRHLLTHSGEKNFICEICSKCFYTLQELNRHVRYHKKEYRFNCQLCEMRFLDKSRFRHHMMRHRNIRPHKCQFCDKMFIVRRKMNLHMAAKHNIEIQSTKAVWKDPKTYISLDDLL